MAALVEDLTAMVTSGASGNGRNNTNRYAYEGASVVVADIRREPL